MLKTNIFILLLFCFAVVSQESGSILDSISEVEIIESDASEEEIISSEDTTDSSGEPLTDSATEESTGTDEVTETTTIDENADNDTIPIGDASLEEEDIVEENSDTENDEEEVDPIEEMIEENSSLETVNSELESELIETLEQLNVYRINEAEKLKQYAKEMELLADYNNLILDEPEPLEIEGTGTKTEIDDDDDDDDDEDEDLETSMAMIAVVGLGFLFLLLHSLRGLWLSFVGSELNLGVYTLLIDTTILVMIWCILAFLEYLDVFDFDLSTILVGLVIFTTFWLFLGLWLLFLSHNQSQNWKRMENMVVIPEGRTAELDAYSMMRQLFISPVYTAPTTESQLRPNFDMANYLSRSLGDIIHNTYHITWVGYSFIIIPIIIWRIVAFQTYFIEIILLWSLPGCIFLTVLILLIKLKRIYSALISENFTGELKVSMMKHLPDDDIRKAIPKPKYLKGKIPEDPERGLICCKVNPFKMTCAYLFLSRYPNRHELLFWFDSYGPNFLCILTQSLVVLHSFWMTGILLYYFSIFVDEVDDLGIYLVVLALVIWLVTGFYLMPKLFVYLALTTKIELMKDRKLIEEVTDESRKKTIMTTIKIYRQMKMIYREKKGNDSEGEQKAPILHYMRKIAEEVFFLVAGQRKTIYVTEIDDVLRLIGVRLNEDELRLFAKECSPDKENFIFISGFMIAIERVLYGYDMDPHEIVRFVLKDHFGKKQKLTVADLNDFFNEWSWHFNEENMKEFLLESQSLADESGFFKNEEIANMIRINVEANPK
ncbi:hypothetical protein SteCoe_23852 [Stentor coeruleus]|uniref:EF-hand domain-containing protein n=1 Tax=Stentor coeruleus TaxID=5963 RepID=A0A1R2BIX5_9CILI|nr:hypothetical protein SteCoe_23852 [Stentor coeruleus]